MESFEDYKKYKWFFTKSKKLVVGGKSDSQNDQLLQKLKSLDDEFYVMHTRNPGSPFCAIIEDIKKVNNADLEECAIFTGCFSRAWKMNSHKVDVDIFKLSQVSKNRSMKVGTWGVSGKVDRKSVELILVLTQQDGVLRAIPEKSANKKDVLAKICPGKIDKKDMVVGIAVEINGAKVSKNEILSALPAGGVRICK